jgi:hypothetical protein
MAVPRTAHCPRNTILTADKNIENMDRAQAAPADISRFPSSDVRNPMDT